MEEVECVLLCQRVIERAKFEFVVSSIYFANVMTKLMAVVIAYVDVIHVVMVG